MLTRLYFQTSQHEEILDITSAAQAFVDQGTARDGALHLFIQHTTCGLTINESADPAVKRDLMRFFGKIAPASGWEHQEGNTDAHIRASLLGSSLLIPVENGRLCLGTWQAVYLYEGDGPRKRVVLAQLLH